MECGLFTGANLFAGHAAITNYLLNYFPGLDLERRNVFGFTALMKAAMQGRTECIRALMLAGTSPPVLPGPGDRECGVCFLKDYVSIFEMGAVTSSPPEDGTGQHFVDSQGLHRFNELLS